jgi:serine/threonine protein kinase
VALASGTKLGPYEIQSLLGAGGMGEVYRARDTRLDRTVAIKILPQHLSENSLAKERFDREARAISSLNHPNICHLYDVGLQDGLNYLVMEYLEGETLADRLLKGPAPLGQTLRYGRDICDGLETAHRSGVIHRDLKLAEFQPGGSQCREEWAGVETGDASYLVSSVYTWISRQPLRRESGWPAFSDQRLSSRSEQRTPYAGVELEFGPKKVEFTQITTAPCTKITCRITTVELYSTCRQLIVCCQ